MASEDHTYVPPDEGQSWFDEYVAAVQYNIQPQPEYRNPPNSLHLGLNPYNGQKYMDHLQRVFHALTVKVNQIANLEDGDPNNPSRRVTPSMVLRGCTAEVYQRTFRALFPDFISSQLSEWLKERSKEILSDEVLSSQQVSALAFIYDMDAMVNLGMDMMYLPDKATSNRSQAMTRGDWTRLANTGMGPKLLSLEANRRPSREPGETTMNDAMSYLMLKDYLFNLNRGYKGDDETCGYGDCVNPYVKGHRRGKESCLKCSASDPSPATLAHYRDLIKPHVEGCFDYVTYLEAHVSKVPQDDVRSSVRYHQRTSETFTSLFRRVSEVWTEAQDPSQHSRLQEEAEELSMGLFEARKRYEQLPYEILMNDGPYKHDTSEPLYFVEP